MYIIHIHFQSLVEVCSSRSFPDHLRPILQHRHRTFFLFRRPYPFLVDLVSTALFSVQAPLHVHLTFVYVTGQYGYQMPILSTIIGFTISDTCHSYSSASLPGAKEQARMFSTN